VHASANDVWGTGGEARALESKQANGVRGVEPDNEADGLCKPKWVSEKFDNGSERFGNESEDFGNETWQTIVGRLSQA
jgi:hypothetical protein